MTKNRKWMLTLACCSAVLPVASARATGASGFTATTLATGTAAEDIDVQNHTLLPQGAAGNAQANLWLSIQKTRGPSALYVQSNQWTPLGTTGWHTHPGHSLIIVTQGTITAYDADCAPRAYTAGEVFVDEGGDHAHVLRNESSDQPAATVAVQLIPAGVARRIDVAAPDGCEIR